MSTVMSQVKKWRTFINGVDTAIPLCIILNNHNEWGKSCFTTRCNCSNSCWSLRLVQTVPTCSWADLKSVQTWQLDHRLGSVSANSSKVSYTHRFKMQFISMMAKLNFQQPLLESSGSHDPWEIILICGFLLKKHYSFLITKIILLLFKKLIIISVENGWKCSVFFPGFYND